jgi:hypothetical protein
VVPVYLEPNGRHMANGTQLAVITLW